MEIYLIRHGETEWNTLRKLQGRSDTELNEVGIQLAQLTSKAFEDVEMDRRYYIEKHKQENLFYIEQRGAISKFISFIPLCAVVLINLIIPFVLEGMQQLSISNMSL